MDQRSDEDDDRLATFDIILGNYHFLLRMINADICGIRFEYLPDLIANQIIDRLHIQFGSQPLLHAVDDGKFGIRALRFL